MAVPEDIRKIERPKNTVIYSYGKNKDKYIVKQRIGCKYKNGRRIPVNGSTVGHIINGKYIPISENMPSRITSLPIDIKDWAVIILCDLLFNDILNELKTVYCEKDSITIYCIAILRVCYKGIKDCELKEAYDTSFLSELYPDVALSKNTVSTFLNDLGKAFSRIVLFMQNRAEKVKIDHHLLIDGTLKSNESNVNCLSNFSRKARIKGSRDISVIFAFDLELMEPICSKCFPGNMLDATSYETFISENKIKQGIIVADKGFPSSAAEEQFINNPNLYYLNPIKRNSKFIETHNLHNYTGILSGYENVVYRKEKCKGKDKWLYSYRDAKRVAIEEADWLRHAKKNETFSNDELCKKQKSFGTVILESNVDLLPEVAYSAYDSRWEIEILMRYYKSACNFDETRVQDDYSVLATEFCDFLSTILNFRLLNKFREKELLDKMTYKKIMHILKCAKKAKLNDEWNLVKINPSQIEILQKLNLLSNEQPEKRKRGRPKKRNV